MIITLNNEQTKIFKTFISCSELYKINDAYFNTKFEFTKSYIKVIETDGRALIIMTYKTKLDNLIDIILNKKGIDYLKKDIKKSEVISIDYIKDSYLKINNTSYYAGDSFPDRKKVLLLTEKSNDVIKLEFNEFYETIMQPYKALHNDNKDIKKINLFILKEENKIIFKYEKTTDEIEFESYINILSGSEFSSYKNISINLNFIKYMFERIYMNYKKFHPILYIYLNLSCVDKDFYDIPIRFELKINEEINFRFLLMGMKI